MPRFEIHYDNGDVLPQAEVAARSGTWVYIERSWNSPIWGFMVEIDEYIIRLFGFVEYDDGGFHPWTWNSTTIFQDTISEVYVGWVDYVLIQRQLEREYEEERDREEWLVFVEHMHETGVLSRSYE